KNGDHYWVDAYVTPLRDKGQVYGYESVRVKADAEVIARAERVYARIMAGKKIYSPFERLWHQWGSSLVFLAIIFIVLLGGSYLSNGLSGTSALGLLGLSALLGGVHQWLLNQKAVQALGEARAVIHDPLAAYIYTGRSDSSGEIMFAQIALKARLNTVLGRFRESARELHDKSEEAHK